MLPLPKNTFQNVKKIQKTNQRIHLDIQCVNTKFHKNSTFFVVAVIKVGFREVTLEHIGCEYVRDFFNILKYV